MAHRISAIMAAALVAAAGTAYGQVKTTDDKQAAKQPERKPQQTTLKVGDKAPEIVVAKWVKGEPVTGFEKGRTYVVEFWATWCGPCKKSIPHLTELQKEHGDVKFVGVSVWEDNQADVEPFVKDWGKKMDYTVAMDEVPALPDGTKADTREAQKFYIDNGTMSKTWMKAAGRGGIPSAFIVDGTGTIQWIGHPMWLDVALEPVMKGHAAEAAEATSKAEKTYTALFRERDPQARLEKFREFEKQYPATAASMQDTKYDVLSKAGDPTAAALGEKLVNEAIKEKDIGKLQAVVMAQEPRDALKTIDAYESANGPAQTLTETKYNLLMRAHDPKAGEVGRQLVDQAVKNKNAQALNQIAWGIVDPKANLEHRDLDLAMTAATKAVEITESKDGPMLDTLAWCHFHKGDAAKAIELEKKAIEVAPEQMKDELKGSLEKFQAGKS